MGRRKNKFVINRKNKNKYAQKEKYDYSHVKGRVVGQLPDGDPIVGSESLLVMPWEHSPYFIRMNRMYHFYLEEKDKFKKEIDSSPHNSVWGEETDRELNHLLVDYTVLKKYGRREDYTSI